MTRDQLIKDLENISQNNNNKEEVLLAKIALMYINQNDIKTLSELSKAHDILDGQTVKERALGSFFITEYTRLSKDTSILNKNKEKLVKILDEVMNNWKVENTVEIGLYFGALQGAYPYIKDNKIKSTIKDIEIYTLNNHIQDSILFDTKERKNVSLDLNLTIQPYKMISSSDLAIEESILIMEDEIKDCQDKNVYLTLFYADRGKFSKCKKYMSKIDVANMNNMQTIVYGLAYSILEAENMVADYMITHRPFGNDNRYEPGNDERLPKIVTNEDVVSIKAITCPADYSEEVILKLSVNENEFETIKGKVVGTGDEQYWLFEVGPFNSFDKVKYYLECRDLYKTEIFDFRVYENKTINKIENIELQENNIKLELQSDNNKDIELYLSCLNSNVRLSSSKVYSEELKLMNDSKFLNVKDNVEIEISKELNTISVYKDEKLIKTIKGFKFICDEDSNIESYTLILESNETEKLYGFGERYNSICQEGNNLDIYLFEQYKNQGKRTYMPVPFYTSNNGYGLFVDSKCYMDLDLGAKNRNEIIITVEDVKVDTYILIGEPKEVVSKFTDITGKPKALPKWAYGPWMSSNNWNTQQIVEREVKNTKKFKIPSTVLVIEAWSDEHTFYVFNDAEYEDDNGENGKKYSDFNFPEWGRWPNPKQMVQDLHDNGLKCVLWQWPGVKHLKGIQHLQKDSDEAYMIEKGYCVHNQDGSVYRKPEGWFKDCLILDFTNEEAKKWWFGKRKYLVDEIGIDGFKTDGGEFVFGRNLKFASGQTGRELTNTYANEYVKGYYDFVNQNGKREGLTFSRAGFTGCQNYPAHWAGDENSTFRAFKSSIIAGLTAGMSGISNWGWDLAGFSGKAPSDDLYIRATQMAAFCPIMQYHTEMKAPERTPWDMVKLTNNEDVLSIYKFYADLRMALIPYIYNEALKSQDSGIPLMRSLFMEYPNDLKCLNVQDQYMFGSAFLVSPIVEEGKKERKVYLPKGRWIDFWTNELYEGGVEIVYESNMKNFPVFVKENSVVVMNLDESGDLQDGVNDITTYNKLTFKLYGSNINSFEFKDDFNTKLTISVKDSEITTKGNCIYDMNFEKIRVK